MKAIAIFDGKTNTYTAYLADFPGVVIQANSKEEMPLKLDVAFDNMVDYLTKKKNEGYSFSETNMSSDELL